MSSCATGGSSTDSSPRPTTRRVPRICFDGATSSLPPIPIGARSTPREVKEILLAGLDARGLSKKKRLAVVADLTERVQLLGEQAHPYNENRKLVAHLTNEIDALFTYLTRPGVDATNWRAEQAIRPAVVNRKLWGGNRTWRGVRTQGRIMSALRTAVQQGLDPIESLVRLARAPDPAMVSLFH